MIDQALIARLKAMKAEGHPALQKIDLDALAAGVLNPEQILETIIALLGIFFANDAFAEEVIALLTALEPIFNGGSGTIPKIRLANEGLGPTPYGPWK